jgi:DNA-binding transcriptional MerR regulator
MSFENLPEKNQYLFKEITSITGVKPYVLRFWESEFIEIHPALTDGGEKLYSKHDLLCVEKIKNLLFDDKLSIPEAKVSLKKELELEAQKIENLLVEEKILDENNAIEAAVNLASNLMKNDLIPQSLDLDEHLEVEDVQSSYSGVETREAIGKLIMNKADSMSDLKESLRRDIENQRELLASKQFNDQDVVRLVQTKKKLNGVLCRIDDLIAKKGWV